MSLSFEQNWQGKRQLPSEAKTTNSQTRANLVICTEQISHLYGKPEGKKHIKKSKIWDKHYLQVSASLKKLTGMENVLAEELKIYTDKESGLKK